MNRFSDFCSLDVSYVFLEEDSKNEHKSHYENLADFSAPPTFCKFINITNLLLVSLFMRVSKNYRLYGIEFQQNSEYYSAV